MKHKRLLRLSKLIGGFRDWDMPWKSEEYERHIVKGIEKLQDGNEELNDLIEFKDDEIMNLEAQVEELQEVGFRENLNE